MAKARTGVCRTAVPAASRALARRLRRPPADPLQGDTLTLVELQDGVTVEQARPALQAAMRGFPALLRDTEQAHLAAERAHQLGAQPRA
jgi:hypothetical protein